MFAINGTTIAYDRPWVHPETGVQYPHDWLRKATPAQKQEIGLVEVEPPKLSDPGQYFDSRFYLAPNQPKDLVELQNEYLKTVRAAAHNQLLSTDWYVIRESDIGALIPESVINSRERIRRLCDAKKERILECENVTALKNYVVSQDFFSW